MPSTSSPPRWTYSPGVTAASSDTTSPEEAQRDLRAHVQRQARRAPGRVRLGPLPAAQLGVGDERRVDVAGDVDLRDHGDPVRRRVGDDPRVVGVGVEATLATADLGRGAGHRQLRPGVDLQPPALIVGQVQVQDVELVERGEVDEAQDVVDAEEVPGDVEHDAAPGVPRARPRSRAAPTSRPIDATWRAPAHGRPRRRRRQGRHRRLTPSADSSPAGRRALRRKARRA